MAWSQKGPEVSESPIECVYVRTFRSLLNDDVYPGTNSVALSLIERHTAHLERFDLADVPSSASSLSTHSCNEISTLFGTIVVSTGTFVGKRGCN